MLTKHLGVTEIYAAAGSRVKQGLLTRGLPWTMLCK